MSSPDPFASGEISKIGLGTYHKEDPAETQQTVEWAMEIGYRHVDTAQYYDNEEYVGLGLERSGVPRDDLFVATKIWFEDLDYDGVMRTTRRSLERLRMDYLDLLYIHWPAGKYDPDETFSAFERLREEERIRHAGVSNFTLGLLSEARQATDLPLFAHQVEMHPLLQQKELHRDALEHDMYLVGYSPFRKGTLFEEMESSAIEDIARAHDATPHQIVLSWFLHREQVLVIPKASSRGHLRQNFEARKLELSEEEVRRIDSIEQESRLVTRPFSPWA